jgi:crotonobetainyl-CoA:carnitine CoA-transferase CaiB-like acyl-CoA transferase
VKRDWKKDRAKAVRHARLVAKRPELREALYGSMSSSMREHWAKPLDPPNILQQARDREHGLDSATLYPARSPANDRNSRNSETEET